MTLSFMRKTIAFASQTGGPRRSSVRVSFGGPVLRVDAALNGFDIGFSRGEHPLKRQQVDVSAVPVAGRPADVDVTVTLALRDDSGNYDDPYEGSVEVLLVAEVVDTPILPLIMGGQTVALRAAGGQYVSAGGNGSLVATRQTIGDDERFRIELLDQPEDAALVDGGLFALRAANGRLVCADQGGGGTLVADRAEIGPWESFVLRRQKVAVAGAGAQLASGDTIAWRTAEKGRFVCAEGGGGRELRADRHRVGPWEAFTLVRV